MAHLLENQAGAFNESNPWGLQIRARAFAGLAKLQATLRQALPQVGAPQVAILLPEQAAQWAESEKLVDLESYINDPIYGLSQQEIADFYPALWNQDVSGSRHWGMPAQRSARLMLYNQSWAQELGFFRAPRSPDEFRQQACAAARASGTPHNGWYLDTHPLTTLSWIYSFDGNILEGDHYRFLSPANLSALTFLKTLFDEGCAWRNPETDPIQAFSTRQALFITLGLESLPEVARAFAAQNSRDSWKVIAFPGATSFVSQGTSYVLFKSSDAAQLAGWLFIRWMLQAENQVAMVKSSGFFPLTRSAHAALSDYATEHPAWEQAVELLEESARPAPALPSWERTKWMLGDGIEEIFRLGLESGQVSRILAELDRTVSEP
uniref:sn-glycerol 3-phosphate transport system substrate-binding protein n=1 Tax=uncultured Chloroflexota bacterium TaxID=166587 RepID=H5SQ60_9CHLR|nr:sn-glycerol 3-phosphate transport system substrate-binding protein [uncultured Chloroflexota bacterium]